MWWLCDISFIERRMPQFGSGQGWCHVLSDLWVSLLLQGSVIFVFFAFSFLCIHLK